MKKTILVHISDIDWDTDGEEVKLPTEFDLDIKRFVDNFEGKNQDLPDDFEFLVGEWLTETFGFCHKGFKYDIPGYTPPTGKFNISYFWRGDNEDTEYFKFETKEQAWEFVKSTIEKRMNAFKKEEETHAKTIIDFDVVKKHLFENGKTDRDDVVYCQCSAWWDNWFFWENEN